MSFTSFVDVAQMCVVTTGVQNNACIFSRCLSAAEPQLRGGLSGEKSSVHKLFQ